MERWEHDLLEKEKQEEHDSKYDDRVDEFFKQDTEDQFEKINDLIESIRDTIYGTSMYDNHIEILEEQMRKEILEMIDYDKANKKTIHS